jgi:hypothetical protein
LKPSGLAQCLVGVVLTATPCAARPDRADFCKALFDLARQARLTGEPQRIAIFMDVPMQTACELSKDRVRDDYCRTALDATGLEFRHLYPWTVTDCLRAQGAKPRMETSHAFPGLKLRRIDHLAAGLPGGVRLDLRYTPDPDSGRDGDMRDYYGRYDLVVWRP